jgi:hypothetical protein
VRDQHRRQYIGSVLLCMPLLSPICWRLNHRHFQGRPRSKVAAQTIHSGTRLALVHVKTVGGSVRSLSLPLLQQRPIGM